MTNPSKPEQPTCYNLVREYFPGVTDEVANDLLWGCTGWPSFFAPKEGQTNIDVLREQLKYIAEKSGGNPRLAHTISEIESDDAMMSLKLKETWSVQKDIRDNVLPWQHLVLADSAIVATCYSELVALHIASLHNQALANAK